MKHICFKRLAILKLADKFFCLFQIFEGSWAYDKPATHLFYEPVLAQYIRIRPIQWVNSISLRVELLGVLGKKKKITIITVISSTGSLVLFIIDFSSHRTTFEPELFKSLRPLYACGKDF